MRLGLVFAVLCCAIAARAAIEMPAGASPRIRYGIEQLERALPTTAPHIVIKVVAVTARPEGFTIDAGADGTITVTGADDSGALYGCLELADRVRAGWLKSPQRIADAPQFVLRGPCIGMQKTYLLPGRKVYEYPYTPEEFPFFYDKAYWTEYLDYLASLRMNTLYLWNGHPFASLVRLPDYPEALEVPPETFARNVEMFRWLAAECDRRGIWLVQQFYSILLSKPLAEKHGLSTQLGAWNDLAADYTRKSIAAFVREFPNVGLMSCLGEALQDQATQTRWMTEVILPGVKDGMAAAGLTEEPPIVLRTHATDATKVMPEALKVYRNLYTEAKFNGESLTTWEPRGVRQQLHLAMSRLGSTHIANVHILANLEPFRYGATEFIQKSVVAMRDRLGARGLHLYPLFYWDWPYSPDVVTQGRANPPDEPLRSAPRLVGDDSPYRSASALNQWQRDWIWFEAWARYAWNPDRPALAERDHWIGRLAEHYGSREAAAPILDAYNAAGECAPRILRRFGITEGNRQTMSLGMTLDQLVRPEKYREFPELWESQSPPGERLKEFAAREAKGLPHEGETPPQIVAEIDQFSARAVAAITEAAPLVTENLAEFQRLYNDIVCIRALSLFYGEKATAALEVLRYQRTKKLAHMQRAEQALALSTQHFRELARLTAATYKAANSMQTAQRRVPLPGGASGKAANYHWTQLLPVYEKELADFRAQVAALQNPGATRTHAPFAPADFKLLTPGLETFTVQIGNTAFSDSHAVITTTAPELEGLQGIKLSLAATRDATAPLALRFSCAKPVRVLVGYFQANGPEWRKPPELETDATAGERGGVEALIVRAVEFDSLPPLNVHAFDYPAGTHTLDVRGTGAFAILGIIQP
ncbi:MAG: hypothetical protein HYV96_00045 [Opitutae bacterium]|nr:hypothetical protein [Opitutae bacterium]